MSEHSAKTTGPHQGQPLLVTGEPLESARAAMIMQRLGGNVTTRLYPHMAHTINRDELRFVQSMMAMLA